MQSVIDINYLEEHEMESKMPRSIRVLWKGSKAHEPVTLTDLIIFQLSEISGFQAQLINYAAFVYLT